jgi:hypothetical protein
VKTYWCLGLCLLLCMANSAVGATAIHPHSNIPTTGEFLAELSDPAASLNGFSVSISGNTVVVGGDDNIVDLYVEPESGWTNTSSPTAQLTCSGALLCTNVAVDGNTVVAVGSTGFGNGIYAVYVFVEPAGGWTNMTQTAELSDSDSSQVFGEVAISGNTVAVVGDASIAESRIDIFEEPVGGWTNMTQSAMLTASNGDYFDAVAMSGGTIVAGAPQGLTDGNGAAYVYLEPPSGWRNMTQTAKLTCTDGVEFGEFGYSVAIGSAANAIVVGAQVNQQTVGAAYVFEEPATGWANMTQTAELTESEGILLSFGDSVAVNKGIVVVGSFQEGTVPFQGYVYLFVMPNAGWRNMTQTSRFTCPKSTGCNEFGYSLSISGKTVVVGAPGHGTGEALVYGP